MIESEFIDAHFNQWLVDIGLKPAYITEGERAAYDLGFAHGATFMLDYMLEQAEKERHPK
jgi:hypothetical protein